MKNMMNLIEAIENMEDLIEAWNEFCNANYYDDGIYHMYELDEILGGYDTPTNLLKKLDTGFCLDDKFFKFNEATGRWRSFDNVHYEIDFTQLANYIADQDNDFNDDKVREALDSMKEEKE